MEPDVTALGEAWAAAERSGDVQALDQLLAADFAGVGPRGFLLSKEQWLARYRSGDLTTASFAWTEVTSRVYNETALLIGRQVTRGAYQGQELHGDFRTTLVFVRQDGAWRLVGLHLSPIVQG